MKVNTVVVEKNPPAGIERYATGLLPYLGKSVDIRTTVLKTKDTTTSSRAIRTYLSLWLQRSNVYREDGEIVHAMGILPFHKDCIDVLNVYDMTPWKFLGLYQKTLPRAMGYGMILQAMHAAPRIITTSEHTKRDIVQMCGKNPEDVYVITGGVDFEMFRPLSLTRRRNTILFVGEDNPRKNLGRLIEGLSLISPPPSLVWAGRKCWPDERKSVTALAARLQVPLTELGYISDQELVQWYNRANLLVYPSLDDAGSFTAIEAMACGLPAAVSNIPPLREELGDLAFYFDPLKPHDIARAVQKGLAMGGKSYLKEDMMRYVRKNFNWDLAAKRTIEVYKQVLNDKANEK